MSAQQPPGDRQNVPSGPESHDAGENAGSSTQRRAGLRGSIWFAFKAIEIRLRFIAILVGIGLVIGYWDSIKNYWDKWTRPTGAEVAVSADEEFYCPMHPSVVRDKPDPGGAIPKCPICGMPLSKRKKGELPELPEGIISRVQLSPYRIELAGIKTVEAELRPLTLDVRTVGYVAIDERKLSRLVVRAGGYVEKLYVNESFAEVAEGDPLAEIYSPELYSAVQELLIAQRDTTSQLAEIAREKLKLLGVADREIDEIVRTGKADSRLIIRSPHAGHVFEKRIVEGDSVQAGQMLFEVADLSTVWIEGEVYEKDAAMLRRGQTVEATVDAIPGRVFEGRVSLVHPHVQTATRTVRVRFELNNPNHALRPGMFATVSLSTPMQAVEPFRTQLAAEKMELALTSSGADRPEVDANVPTTGDELRPASDESLIAMQKVCPVTGAKLGSMGKPLRATADGRTVFLCCAGCKDELAGSPDYYLRRLRTVSEEGVLAVPEQALIDTGNLKIVYIEREPGLFEGVAVTVGTLAGGYYPVIDGLLPGDRVAAAGAFLVDAETRLNPGAASTYFGASGAPSSGSGSPAPSATRSNETGPDASPSGASEKERANMAKLPEADRGAAERQRICPITDLSLGSMGVPYKMTVEGRKVFLCCESCKSQVAKDPQAALAKIQKNESKR
ncbi:MAG: RND transporter [Planctomycetota bacterium]|nr:MAG: RND transporter [Planctomycetota bacterium]